MNIFTHVVVVLAVMCAASILAIPGRLQAETSVAARHVVGSDARLDMVLNALQRHYDETRSFSAKFIEQIAPVGAPTRTRTGTVMFLKPGRMRWNFETPSKEILVSDGTTVFDYDPGLDQVVETRLSDTLRAPGATEFLLGAGNIRKDFIASAPAASAADGLDHVLLHPRAGGNPIELGVDAQSGDIRSIKIVDQLGNATTVVFSDLHDNAEIASSEFQFTPPAGADIVSP